MDKIKILVNLHKDKLNIAALGCAILAGINCLERPDYNIFVYLYMYYVWYMMNDVKDVQAIEKINCIYFLAYSLIIDIVWNIFWTDRWSNVKNYEQGAHTLVLTLSWIAFLLKSVILFSLGLLEWNSLKSSLPSMLREKLNAAYGEQRDEI